MAENTNINNITDKTQFVLPLGRVTFESLFKPQQFEGKGDFKYSIGLIFPPEETFETYKKVLEEFKQLPEFKKLDVVFPGSAEAKKLLEQGIPPEEITYVSRAITKKKDPEFLAKYPHMVDQWTMKASRKESWGKPVVVDNMRETIENPAFVFAGCYGHALVSLGLFNKTTLYFRLHGFQKVKNGVPLSGNRSRVDLFESFTSEEPTVAQFQSDDI